MSENTDVEQNQPRSEEEITKNFIEKANIGPVLSERDRELLLESGTNITKRLLSDYPDKLPDAIILPDLTSRIFSPLLRPILEKVAKQRGCDTPIIYHMKVVRDRQAGMINSLKRSYGSLKEARQGLTETINNAKAKLAKATNPFVVSDLEWTISYWGEQLELIAEDSPEQLESDVRQHRANEIKSDLERRARKDPKIVIIDDYASEDANTITAIRDAFGSVIPAYVFLGQHETLIPKKIFVGVFDDRALSPATNLNGFDFRNKNFSQVIGYRKEPASYLRIDPHHYLESDPYVYQIHRSEEDILKAVAMVSEMRNIGKQIGDLI